MLASEALSLNHFIVNSRNFGFTVKSHALRVSHVSFVKCSLAIRFNMRRNEYLTTGANSNNAAIQCPMAKCTQANSIFWVCSVLLVRCIGAEVRSINNAHLLGSADNTR